MILCFDGLIIDSLLFNLIFRFCLQVQHLEGNTKIMDGRREMNKRDEGAWKISQQRERFKNYKPVSQGWSFLLSWNLSSFCVLLWVIFNSLSSAVSLCLHLFFHWHYKCSSLWSLQLYSGNLAPMNGMALITQNMSCRFTRKAADETTNFIMLSLPLQSSTSTNLACLSNNNAKVILDQRPSCCCK